MNLEAVLNYVTLHNQAIIQWLVVAILSMVATLIALALFGRPKAHPSADLASLPNAGDLAETLKKMMEQQGGTTPAPAEATAPAAEAGAPASTERLRALEGELRLRDDEIAQLKAAKATAGDAAVDEGMATRLAELEAKLSEYEILEDDIADLSLYKEENTRLRAELEALKGDGAPVPTAAVAAPAELADADPTPEPAPEPAPEPTQPARTAEAAAEAAASLALFEAAAAPAPAPVASAANEPIQRDLSAEADDLFAEFATALEESGVNLSVDVESTKTSA